MDSILTSIKKLLGIEEDDTHFDPDIIMHINSVLFILTQIGVGPSTGFTITDKTTEWTDFITDITKIELVKTYVYQKVRLAFDPPINSAVLNSMTQMTNEFEWRLNVAADAPTTT